MQVPNQGPNQAQLAAFKAETRRIARETSDSVQLARIDTETALLEQMRELYAQILLLEQNLAQPSQNSIMLANGIAANSAQLAILKSVWDERADAKAKRLMRSHKRNGYFDMAPNPAAVVPPEDPAAAGPPQP